MTDMAEHRKGWTAGEMALAVVYTALCPLIGFFAFVEIYQTVTHLVHPWFGDWAWIVPASAEGMFTALYAGWVLLELRDTPPRRVRWLLAAFLCACGLSSYWLNIAGAHGAVNDAVAHAVVVTAFFGVLIFGKVLVRRLKVTPGERAMEAATADASRYAIDLVRAVRGRWWRFDSGIPSLLKRQLATGRLPDAVREDIRLKVSLGRSSGWEAAVRGWVYGPDGLAFATLAGEAAKLAVSDIARQAAATPEATPAPPVPVTSQPAAARPPVTSRPRPKRKPAATPRLIPDASLKEQVQSEFEANPAVSVNAAAKALGRSRDRIRPLLEEVRREANVSPLERKKA